jgi:hypothetical protein
VLAALASLGAALLELLNRVGQYLQNKQLLDAGKAEQQVIVQEQVEANVKKADDAAAVPDAERTQRLRQRFDTAYGNE